MSKILKNVADNGTIAAQIFKMSFSQRKLHALTICYAPAPRVGGINRRIGSNFTLVRQIPSPPFSFDLSPCLLPPLPCSPSPPFPPLEVGPLNPAKGCEGVLSAPHRVWAGEAGRPTILGTFWAALPVIEV